MNTNAILKQVVAHMSNGSKESFVRLLGADLQLVIPMDHTHINYRKQYDEDILFLFINNKFDVIGMLTGRKFDKKYESYMTYGETTPYKYIAQNWKNLESCSKYILGLTPQMRKLRVKKKEKQIPKTELRQREILAWTERKYHYGIKSTISSRLEIYKTKKHSNITHDQIMEKVKFINTKLIENLFAPKEIQEELHKKCKKIAWATSPKVSDLLRSFTNDLYDYTCKKTYLDESQGTDGYILNYRTEDYNKFKLVMLEWYNAIA